MGFYRSGRLFVSLCLEGVTFWDGLPAVMKRSPRSASAEEDITDLTIWEIMMTAPLFAGMGESFDMKKWSPARLLAFDYKS